MFGITDLLISILAFIGAIGILVTFHEFGHFWVARRLGVKVLRFSVGFGKPLCTWRDKYNTEYVIAAIPLGGYVKMLDEREGEVSAEELPHAFNRQSVWRRFAIVLAGPLFNFLFAILVYWFSYMVGVTGVIPNIGDIRPASIAAHSGLVAGQEIVSVDGTPTSTWASVIKQLMRRIGDQDALQIQVKDRDQKLQSYTLNLAGWELKGKKPDPLAALGIEPYHPPTVPLIKEVFEDAPAPRAGVLPGDRILSVNGTPIDTWKAFTDRVRVSAHKLMVIEVQRGNKTETISFTPQEKEAANGEIVGFAGLITKTAEMPKALTRKEHLSAFEALNAALHKTWDYIAISYKVIGKMIVGDVGLHTLSGPLTIAQGAGISAMGGIQYYLGFLALISISLGVLNLLPIPILDGGHLLYYLIEMVIRKPVSENVQLVGFKLGMFFLIFLMTIAFYNDLMRLF